MQDSPDNSPIVIELTGVDVPSAHGGDKQLEGVNWRVRAGDYWIVGGAQASGKSDLMATAAGLQRPLAGSLRLFGRDFSELSEAERLQQRSRIGVVFKNGGRMFSQLTVAENIALPLCYRHDWTPVQARPAVEELLQLTGLEAFARSVSAGLGVGWQQRVGLARALALKPEVLFFDEPIASLEARHRQWWHEFLAKLAGGTPFTEGRPVTLIVMVNDFEPWRAHGRQFALVKEKRWLPLSGKFEI